MNIVKELCQDIRAIPLLYDWLGKGGSPVDSSLSESRASVCRTCEHNVEPGWWEKAKFAVAEVIRKELEIKNRMEIKVSCESELHMCRICGCCNPLKVHVPIEHVKEHTPAVIMQKFPPWCWIVKELEH